VTQWLVALSGAEAPGLHGWELPWFSRSFLEVRAHLPHFFFLNPLFFFEDLRYRLVLCNPLIIALFQPIASLATLLVFFLVSPDFALWSIANPWK
jgi:hypothetical protein